ncbi:hypothetical protein GOY17_13950 [Lysobacter soli]|uniref:hypothetical protein n=1 Tax=Lysobacter soli TaxID=453783 RepID=UPI0012ECEA9F|nr:hypothetical protein [Lysobacter soli]QGW65914.1 hypothetical protein GOY17_13950 [Lysobacter soli]
MKKNDLLRAVLAVTCVWMLTAASWPTRLPAPSRAPARAYTLVDKRDPKSLKSGFESLMITNCAYGIMRLGDNDIDPHLTVLLDDALAARFGDRLAGKQITLDGFAVHLNNALALRNQMTSMYGGLVDTLMNKKKVGCAAEDLSGGYTVGEVQPGMAPIIAAVSVHMDGKTYFGRGIVEAKVPAPPRKKAEQSAKDAWNASVAAAVAQALADLADKLEAGLAPGAVAEAPLTP